MMDKLDKAIAEVRSVREHDEKMEQQRRGEMNKKLYRITCKGMRSETGAGVAHGIAYVVASNSDEAYQKLRRYLDEKDLGFASERELQKVELIAEETDYPDCGISLYT